MYVGYITCYEAMREINWLKKFILRWKDEEKIRGREREIGWLTYTLTPAKVHVVASGQAKQPAASLLSNMQAQDPLVRVIGREK